MTDGSNSERSSTPANIVAEAAFLGVLLRNNEFVDRAADIVSPKDFYSPGNGRIFSAIIKLVSEGRHADPVTLRPMFLNDPLFQHMDGGISRYLAEITGNLATTVGVWGFARQISELARRRRLIESLEEAVLAISDTSEDMTFAEAVNRIETACMTEKDFGDGVVLASAQEAFRDMVGEMEEDGGTGVTAPAIPSLNQVLGPIKPHQNVILAGRPGAGKTAVALSYAISAASAGHGTLFITREMSRIELMQRGASCVTFDGYRGVPYELIRDRRLNEDDKRRVMTAGSAFRDMPLHFVDAGSLSLGRLNSLVRRYKRRFEAAGKTLDLVVIDYLQLLKPDGKSKGRYEDVSEVSEGVKSIAKTYGVGCLTLAQLSRECEKRENKRPMLSDLRDSGSIEQDADKVCFLYREEYYLRQARSSLSEDKFEAALASCEKQIEFIVAKRRDGTTGTATAEFHGAFMAVRG